ncbi:efflux RND transporter permease subunit [Sulfurimonas sp. HSL-1716]|uniref:efflux RND transporter permease subunit n=1 Tax=Hydrocurvibacter sulfurireducens TaxID=3131937 RepID=UPI0031F90814
MIRRFVEFAIDKPILNHIFLLFILVMSAFAYLNVPKEIFPPIDTDQIIISGGYAGTSPDVLDKMAAKNIEDELKNIESLDTIKTVIKNGAFTITVDIKRGSNNISVLNDVKDAIDKIKHDLPSDMNDPIAKIQEKSFPLVLIALAGKVSTKELIQRADELKSELSKLKDLSEITIRGDADDELVFRINEERIKAYGLDQPSVVAALSNISSIFPVGTIKQRGSHLFISTYNGEKNKKSVEDTLISVLGKRVRIGDIAAVSFELSDESEISHYNGVRNISVNITKSKSGNAIALSRQIKQILKEKEKQYPNLQYRVYTDTSIWIKNRLNTVVSNILFGLILVFASLLIFVNRGIAFVVAIGIPVSFMIGLIATQLLGDSINMLSLLGALIALGMLVDEAIVVAENIYRHLEEGKSRREAAVIGAVEMFPAVLTATLTTIFAFLPMLLLTGDMGAFIKIIPVMISVLLLSSLFEAFYFLPLHAYDFLRLQKESFATHSIWAHLYRWYDVLLHFLFRKKLLSLIMIVVSILLGTFVMVKQSKFQLFPEFDVTQIYVSGKVDVNSELQDTEKQVTRIEKMLLKKLNKKEFSSVTSVIGIKIDAKNEAELGDNLFQIFIDLKERAPDNFYNRYINPFLSIDYDKKLLVRERDAKDMAEEIKEWIKNFKNEKDENKNPVFDELSVTVPGAGVVANDIEISLSGKSEDEIIKGVKKLQSALFKVNGVYNIADDAAIGAKELKLRVNRYGQSLGFNEQTVSNQLRSFYLKGEYAKMFNEDGLIRIRVEGDVKDRLSSLNDIELSIPGSDRFVSLKDICDFIVVQGFVTINKEDGKRIRTVFASLDKRKITSSEVMQKITPVIKELQKEGYTLDIKGEEKENNKNKKEIGESAIIAIFLIFITLIWLFNSFRKSLIVLSTIPLSLLGVLAGHLIMGINITMPGLIGIVGLAGVVVNDGLIMVSFIKEAKNSEELMKMARTRLRPILLTSITTVLGLSTLIFFASGQALILQPMAVSLGFGVTWATVLNLIYVPLLYAVVYRIRPPVQIA